MLVSSHVAGPGRPNARSYDMDVDIAVPQHTWQAHLSKLSFNNEYKLPRQTLSPSPPP